MPVGINSIRAGVPNSLPDPIDRRPSLSMADVDRLARAARIEAGREAAEEYYRRHSPKVESDAASARAWMALVNQADAQAKAAAAAEAEHAAHVAALLREQDAAARAAARKTP